MSDQPRPDHDGLIRISDTEARSAHVDDLLRRQANLRGDTGIARDRRGRWWLQSWFVLMLAGACAALLAWAIIEPYFDDNAHLRGKVDAIEVFEQPQVIASAGGDGKADKSIVILGTITVRGQTVQLGSFTRSLAKREALSADDLPAPGTMVDLYAEGAPNEQGTALVWLALFLDPAPPGALPDEGLSLERLAQRSQASGMVIFALMAALIGLFVGAADGLVCRVWTRAALSGLVGLGVGFLGGFILSIIANLVYQPLNEIAQSHTGAAAAGFSPLGFGLQMAGRAIAWGLAGVAMGLGQGIALRSGRMVVFGLVGGVVGGVLGGLLFDPIDLILLGTDKPSAHVSRLVGFLVIGASVGGMIGLVELLARDAWLRMEQGPLAGKEFLVFKDVMKVGSSPRSDIYLFNDPRVEGHHATLRAVGEDVEVESANPQRQVLVNDRPVKRSRLRHGDRITLGRTVFIYQKRGG